MRLRAPRSPKTQERKIGPKRKFLGRTSCGHPGVIRADIQPKTSVRVVKILEKKQAFWRGHPWPEGADVHDPKGFQKLRSEKLWAEFSFPKKTRTNEGTKYCRDPTAHKVPFSSTSLQTNSCCSYSFLSYSCLLLQEIIPLVLLKSFSLLWNSAITGTWFNYFQI